MGGVSASTIKTLFALSCNRCAYPGCEEPLTDPGWVQVKADIAHIRGNRPGSARYNESMTDEERCAYEYLLLVCPNHHRLIDRLDPDAHPVERLHEIKQRAESTCRNHDWASPQELEQYATLILAGSDSTPELAVAIARPRLVVVLGDKDAIEVRNVGDADAFEIIVEPIDAESEAGSILGGIAPGTMSPGAVWRAGFHTATFGHPGPHAVRVRWSGSNGTAYDAEFPL